MQCRLPASLPLFLVSRSRNRHSPIESPNPSIANHPTVGRSVDRQYARFAGRALRRAGAAGRGEASHVDRRPMPRALDAIVRRKAEHRRPAIERPGCDEEDFTATVRFLREGRSARGPGTIAQVAPIERGSLHRQHVARLPITVSNPIWELMSNRPWSREASGPTGSASSSRTRSASCVARGTP
jgi:hypothetical protein